MSDSSNDITKQKLIDDFKTLVQDGEELLKAGADELSKETRDKLTDLVGRARTIYGSVEERALAQARAADQAIQDHPYESIGIAFGVGVLLGLVLTRR
jgi:ElaB/YqjD/DUF883 family membrane-anchored ribosome-binding protein